MIRVLLVDDHPVVRAGYQRLLEQQGDIAVVAQAGDAQEAFALFCQTQPDLVISDISMPGSSGLALIQRLREREPRCRILIFSMHDSEAMMRRALDLGASGFVSKSSAPEALLEAVRSVHAGRVYLPPSAPAEADLSCLSPREYEVFRLLASGHSLQDCAKALQLSAKTVSNHQTLIKEKLGLSSLAALALLAVRQGLV
ncbi:DNA-binding response regulator [Paucibacter sp. KBW04]|uniref:response regulator transcription factor n=1 Tax=Paucibacter sp. KBW04 TaxID=2153361 RepID=UPI000F56FC56|nr:response regulator transcription factor [Paucibacter sp. KBW04]RQO63492.1 DNA-binding response regulator [Paucibacter sp. KBW04]